MALVLCLEMSSSPAVHAQDSYPPTPEPYFSTDGLTLYNAVPPLIVVVDDNPDMQGIRIPAGPEVAAAIADLAAASATFSITYVASSNTNILGDTCMTFPDNEKTAFNAAAAIWANTLQSSVPITIEACWADMGSPNILGHSGGQPLRRDFSGAPQANTWYQGSLANALHGSDLDPASFDMSITYNSTFDWYTGTDSNPPAGQYDLVTVAAHEIAHGLNFSGSAQYAGGTGSYGYGTGYPNIYDTFMESSGGTKLTSYTNPSPALGTLLTSNSLWFNGINANAANGGSRVKMYAPSSWAGGSSYSHLDYTTFAGTANSMMVYAIGSGSANHNPGPVTRGLLKDLGWELASSGTSSSIYLPLVLKNYGTSGPTAGFWESATGDEFYVTPDQASVEEFAIYITVYGCGNYKITHHVTEPIAANQFSFSGAFYANGTFDSATSAHGTDGLSSFDISGCGLVSGGPWSWTATWKNSSQPASVAVEGDASSIILVPDLRIPTNHIVIIEP